MTATAGDVAEYILKKTGTLPAMKLQKLVYYCQAWSLVWEERPLFNNRIEAWANGPIIRDLYSAHRLQYEVSTVHGNPDQFEKDDRETINSVVDFYGDKSSQWLSDLTHTEHPWKDAREGLEAGERGTKEITCAAMAEYYESL